RGPRAARRRSPACAPGGGGACGGRRPGGLGAGVRSPRGDLPARADGGRPRRRPGAHRAMIEGGCTMSERPRVGITMGGAAGIGPEITVKSLGDPIATTWAIPIVLGDARVLERAMEATGVRLPIRTLGAVGEAEGRPGTIELLDYANIDMGQHRWG